MADRRLKIVVPYRDRAAHLAQFLPHIRDYLDDAGIAAQIVIAEQAPGEAFNRGAMKNAGFLLGGPSDYTCFHDVDYLPLDADYSWSDDPVCLVTKGTDRLATQAGGAAIALDMTKFFGGAVLMPDALFARIDGYSNQYWGWGYEDTDLVARLKAVEALPVRRPGAFVPLPHDSHGYEADGSLGEDAGLNRLLYQRTWQAGARRMPDGLSTLAQEVLAREMLAEGVEKVTVRLRR